MKTIVKMIKSLVFLGLFFALHLGFAQSNSNDYSKFRIGVQGGYSYRLGSLDNIPSDFKAYTKKLKSGFNIGVEGAYFFKPKWGLGLKYNSFMTKESLGGVIVEFNDGSSATGSISDDIRITFIGAIYIVNFIPNNEEHAFYGSFGAGYLAYRDDAVIVDREVEITGNTFGSTVDFAYDYKLSDSIAIGAQVSLMLGKLSEITVKDEFSEQTQRLDGDNQDDLARLDFSVGIRFYL